MSENESGIEEVLAKAEIFSRYAPENIRRIARVFRERMLAQGDALFTQGEEGNFLAVVAKGQLVAEVEAEEGPTEVSRMGPGTVVGAMACLDPGPRSATVRATTDTWVLVLSRDMLDKMKEKAPQLYSVVVQSMMTMLAEMLAETNEQITGFLEVKRAPTGPRQPSLKKMEEEKSRGLPLEEFMDLPRRGVMEALSDEEWKVLRRITLGRKFGSEEVICLEGERARGAYLLVHGEVDVLRTIDGTTYRLARIPAGSFLGQQSLLTDGVRTATLRAVQDGTVVLGLSRENFEALLQADSPLAWRFQEVVARAAIRQLRQANSLLGYLGVRESKRVIPNLGGRPLRVKAKKKPIKVDKSLAGITDVDALAAAYLETAMQDWSVTPSEVKSIRVVKYDGEMSAQELKLRQKFKK